MKLIVDIDGTICTNTNGEYEKAEPIVERIEHLNKLYDSGHEIHYWTARGSKSGLDWTELTGQQLKKWNVKYTTYKVGKPHYDYWIDDKAMDSELYFAAVIKRA